ncbi:MAG TPA: DpnI domain-containing protein [Terracidiphilus sp.]|nr:DpnI domain-containing protein [Terracidiphilus sp.]
MQLTCNLSLAERYKSASQQARVLSEDWFARNAYCLACDADEVKQTKANTGATDFVCPKCGHGYEMKTYKGREPRSLNDGAFAMMMGHIRAGVAPSLCLLQRTADWTIRGLNAIHSSFVLPDAIVARPPLSKNAKREGWVGCTIRLDKIDLNARVGVIHDGIVLPVKQVRQNFQRFLPLARKSVEQRGWTLLTLAAVRSLGKREFSLSDIYALETRFSEAYPQNQHVRDKVRQQLQVLRDLGVLKFEGRGEYRLLG